MIVDFHTHIFPPEVRSQRERYARLCPRFSDLYLRPNARLATAEEIVAEMDAAGVDVAVVAGFDWETHDLCVEHNDYLIDAIRRYPGRLVGFCAVLPTAGEVAVYEAERCLAHGMRGIGELNTERKPYDYTDLDVVRDLFDFAVAHDLIVLAHTSEPIGHDYPGKGTATPGQIWHWVEAFPNLTLVCAHWGGGLPFYELMPEVRRMARRVYYDTAASPYLYEDRVFPIGAALVGAERILWGSDYPLLRMGRFLERVRRSGLTTEQQRLILGANAARLLRLPLPEDGRVPSTASLRFPQPERQG